MRNTRLFTLLFAGLFPLIGVILLVISASIYISHERARGNGVLTTGLVVGIEERYFEADDPEERYSMYAPVVHFTTDNGEDIVFTSSTWARPVSYGPGDRVEVLYQRENPHEAEIETAFERYGASAILGVAGIVLGAVGAFVAFVLNKLVFAGTPAVA